MIRKGKEKTFLRCLVFKAASSDICVAQLSCGWRCLIDGTNLETVYATGGVRELVM